MKKTALLSLMMLGAVSTMSNAAIPDKLAEDAYLVIEERFSDKKDLFKVVEADLVEAEEVVKKYI